MFTIAGILADEEPKTPISPNGLYNTSNLGSLPSGGSDLSSVLLNGKSEFTLMAWISVDDFSIFGGSGARPFVEFNPASYPIALGSTGVSSSIKNSNGGTTTVTHLDTYSENTFYHVCVTQSLSNNRIRVYVDGVLLNSAVMNYGNDTNSTTFRIQKQDGVSISQFNAYDRELPESEVSEHYIDQNGQVGVLAYDAMTTAQRSGLIYCASLTDDISFDGNEFKDRSTNNISLSTAPSLTGQQIYVYTALSQIYAVNSAEFNGTNQYLQSDDSTDLNPNLSTLTVVAWVYLDGTSFPMLYTKTNGAIERININVNTNNKFEAYVANSSGIQTEYEFGHVMLNGWNHIVYNFTRTSINDMGQLIVNGVDVGTSGTWKSQNLDWSTSNIAPSGAVEIARLNITGGPYYYSQSQAFTGYAIGNTLSLSEAQYLYNNGDAKCWDDVNSEDATLYAKFDEVWDLGTFNGSTESQALQGKKGLTNFVNIGSTPFTGTGLNVECDEAPVYAVNSIALNGTSQYVVSTNASNYNFGTDAVFVSGWAKSGENHKLYFKGNETGTSNQDLFINAEVLSSREVVFDLSVNVSNRRQWVTTATPIPNDGNWHHVAIYHARTNDTTQPVLWVDGVSQGAIPQSYTIGSGWASANFTQAQPMKLGVTAIPAFYGVGTGNFVCTIKGYSPTQSDIDELYNGGTPKCYTDVDPTLKARFMSFIDCGTYNGRTETQALTEHVESEVFTNINSAPFTGTGLNVECSS